MKAIILAAGEGKRMRPLTLTTPKPLLEIKGRTILDHIFDALPEDITEVIVTVKYLGEKIKEYLGEEYRGKKIRYVEGSLEGNAIGFVSCKNFFRPGERFLILYGDELQRKEDIKRVLEQRYAWVCVPVEDPRSSGIATLDANQRILDVVEKPERPLSNLAAAGTIMADAGIFSYEPVRHANGEYYLSSMLNQFVKDHEVRAVIGKPRPAMTSPEDLTRDFEI
jgi:bifunctional UDP-N-acetylglucosamine pyrophosphorylase/glucosamine-1-phosphate N-acetyltransferase